MKAMTTILMILISLLFVQTTNAQDIFLSNSIGHQMTKPSGYYFDNELGYQLNSFNSLSLEYFYSPGPEEETAHYLELNFNTTYSVMVRGKFLNFNVSPLVVSNFEGEWGYGLFVTPSVSCPLTRYVNFTLGWKYYHSWGDVKMENNSVLIGLTILV